MEYGEIKNICTEYNGINRIGDYGKDEDGNSFCYTSVGWKPINKNSYDAYYWKKQYTQLKAKMDKTENYHE